MRIMSMVSRHRVAALALTLALTLGAMVTTPAAASAPWICEDGCWSWNSQTGCTQEVTCCANGGTGDWFCILW